MKKPNSKYHFQFLKRLPSRLACGLVLAMLSWGAGARAQEDQTKSSDAKPATGALDKQDAAALSGAANQPPAEALSPTTSEVLRMMDAEIPAAVIQTYVECNPSTAQLNATDIIALKKHHVPDEIVIALMKQGAKVRALDQQRRNDAAARALAIRNAKFGGLDPESYEYFQYYYLQPRALASVYNRLAPYYGPWAPYRSRPFSVYRPYERPH
jgi:hypothetical protein